MSDQELGKSDSLKPLGFVIDWREWVFAAKWEGKFAYWVRKREGALFSSSRATYLYVFADCTDPYGLSYNKEQGVGLA